jgi:SNF2 family DNA or RNA helicase
MENHYLEFFSLCDLVVPGCLGDVDSFRKKYYNNEVRSESLRELRLISKPLLLRRTKQQVQLTLPEKTIQKVLLPFDTKQKEIYKKMAMTFSRQVEDLIRLEGESKAQIAMFSALMRLRQICSDPAAVPGVSFEELPVKVEHFLKSLEEHLENQESVIVFTQFLSTLGRIEKELHKMKVPVFVLQGNVSSKERLRLISEFQNSDQPGVMLMTLKTGGVGLNLTKASVVYHLEPWWNPAVENQATDRAHRMGQTKDVKVYNLLI